MYTIFPILKIVYRCQNRHMNQRGLKQWLGSVKTHINITSISISFISGTEKNSFILCKPKLHYISHNISNPSMPFKRIINSQLFFYFKIYFSKKFTKLLHEIKKKKSHMPEINEKMSLRLKKSNKTFGSCLKCIRCLSCSRGSLNQSLLHYIRLSPGRQSEQGSIYIRQKNSTFSENSSGVVILFFFRSSSFNLPLAFLHLLSFCLFQFCLILISYWLLRRCTRINHSFLFDIPYFWDFRGFQKGSYLYWFKNSQNTSTRWWFGRQRLNLLFSSVIRYGVGMRVK